MITRILALSLRNRLLVLLASLFVAGYGTYVAVSMPIDVLPDLNRPTVVVMADAHAMVPEDIERRLTLPLEQMLNGATDVVGVRSASGMGLSMIFVEFAWGSDIYRNRQIVQEKLQLAKSRLPPDVEPVMAPITSIMGQVQWIGVQSRTGATHVDELRALADWQVKLRLMSVPGVAKVVASGGSPRQLQAIVDADKLRVHDVTLEQVAAAIRGANLNVSGGFLTIGHKAPVITVKGFVHERKELASAVVKPDPVRPVRLSDVARVEFGPAAVRTGDAGINGRPGVILAVFKQIDTDTVALTDRIRDELDSIQAGMPEDVVIIGDLFQQSEFIHRAVDNVLLSVRDGSLLVVIVLFFFLMKFRTMLITISAIPLSVAVTALVFAACDLSINTMTLGGIAVAIGALVDDAIVDVENVLRRLRENAVGKRLGPLLVIYRASSEVRRPILIGTFLVVVVYLPLFWLSGLEGRLFTPIGIAYVTSVLASLLVSLTLTPVLCWYLLGRDRSHQTRRDTWLVRQLKRGVGSMIRTSVAHSAVVLALLLSAVIGTVVVLGGRGTQFLPPFNEGVAQINLFLPPETGLEESDRFGRRLGVALTEVEGVRHVSRRTGRADGDEHVHGVNFSHTIVSFEPEAERTREQIVDAIRAKLALEFPGVITEVSQPLAHLLAHLLSGVKAQVAIKVFGPDLDILRRIAADVEAAVRPVTGVVDLYTEPQVLVDQIAVEPRREALARHGLTVHQIAELVELALEGERVSQMQLEQYIYPIVIRLEADDRRSLDSLRGLRLRSAAGSLLRLEDVAKVSVTKTPNNINRENVSRRIAVQHNVAGRALGDVVADVQAALAPIEAGLAPGYAIRIGGQYQAQQQASQTMYGLSGLAFGLMFLILYLHFRSVNLSLQVLVSIPMAFVGAVLWIALSGQAVSVATLVGLIALGGIASRNGILLIDHYLHLMREENEPFGTAMIIRAGQERMVPVVMTALTSGIALVPIAISADQPGREILYPVATVIIFGLVSSTILDFLVRPALFFALGRREAERLVSLPQAPDPSALLMTDTLENEQGV